MTHSNFLPDATDINPDDPDQENVDFDATMDSIPTIGEEAEEALSAEPKTARELYIEDMENILSIKNISSWERGFCTSCTTYLNFRLDAMLSYKQKHVLGQLVAKYLGA